MALFYNYYILHVFFRSTVSEFYIHISFQWLGIFLRMILVIIIYFLILKYFAFFRVHTGTRSLFVISV